jgi:hypothetical protein
MFSKGFTHYFKNRDLVISSLVSLALLLISLVANFYAGTYATEKASNSVTDLILNNIPVFDVDGIFVYGPLFFWAFCAIFVVGLPQRIPFTLKSISVFVFIRSVFITLTHIGPPPGHMIIPASNVIDKFAFGGDLFFSAHTGLPFLLALIFWDQKILRYIFILTSLFFAAIVLMGHIHYSIDVLGAYFITYSIFHISEFFFKTDQKIFKDGLYSLGKEFI